MDREEQTDLIGPAQVQVGADDRFEEASTPERLAEDLRQADFELPDRQSVRVASSPIGERQGLR